jgi:hypothetical protein
VPNMVGVLRTSRKGWRINAGFTAPFLTDPSRRKIFPPKQLK